MAIPTPQVIRSHRASLSIQVNSTGEIIVKAPILVPNFVINKFIHEKEAWIQKALAKIKTRKRVKKTYKEGETFLFLGKPYTLSLSNTLSVQIKNEKLLLPKVAQFRAQKELMNWFIQQARDIIAKRVAYHARKMGAHYTGLLFSDTKSKWGTCFPDNSLQFNWRLVMAPLMVLDYVVIHELTHTTEKNHGDSFWRKVRLFTPAYKQHRKWLEENAHLLIV